MSLTSMGAIIAKSRDALCMGEFYDTEYMNNAYEVDEDFVFDRSPVVCDEMFSKEFADHVERESWGIPLVH